MAEHQLQGKIRHLAAVGRTRQSRAADSRSPPLGEIEDDCLRKGKALGMSNKNKRPKIKGPYVVHTSRMLNSLAFRTLSLTGHRILARIELELCRHAGKDNGTLIVTYDDFE